MPFLQCPKCGRTVYLKNTVFCPECHTDLRVGTSADRSGPQGPKPLIPGPPGHPDYVVEFGQYPQDLCNDPEILSHRDEALETDSGCLFIRGKRFYPRGENLYFLQPIVWIPLPNNLGYISEKILDLRRYDGESTFYPDSELCAFLNGDFKKRAFGYQAKLVNEVLIPDIRHIDANFWETRCGKMVKKNDFTAQATSYWTRNVISSKDHTVTVVKPFAGKDEEDSVDKENIGVRPIIIVSQPNFGYRRNLLPM